MVRRNVVATSAVLGCGLLLAACSSGGTSSAKSTAMTTAAAPQASGTTELGSGFKNPTTAAAAAPAAAAGAVDCAALKKARDAVNGDNGSFDSYSAEAKAIANDANVTATEIGKVAPAAAAAYKTQVDAALQAAGNDGARLNDFLTGTGVTLGSIGNSTGVHAQVATSCPKPRGDGDRALRPTGPDRTLP